MREQRRREELSYREVTKPAPQRPRQQPPSQPWHGPQPRPSQQQRRQQPPAPAQPSPQLPWPATKSTSATSRMESCELRERKRTSRSRRSRSAFSRSCTRTHTHATNHGPCTARRDRTTRKNEPVAPASRVRPALAQSAPAWTHTHRQQQQCTHMSNGNNQQPNSVKKESLRNVSPSLLAGSSLLLRQLQPPRRLSLTLLSQRRTQHKNDSAPMTGSTAIEQTRTTEWHLLPLLRFAFAASGLLLRRLLRRQPRLPNHTRTMAHGHVDQRRTARNGDVRVWTCWSANCLAAS
jgi:hypothetical protein